MWGSLCSWFNPHTGAHQAPTVAVFTPHKGEEEREEELAVEEKESPRSPELGSGLLESPALKFITRKDLYTFLSSAGVRRMHMGRGGCGERDVHGEERVCGEGSHGDMWDENLC